MTSSVQAVVVLILVCLMLASTSGWAAAAPPQLLRNPGLEAPYTVLPPSTGKAQITGSVADGWADNSGWADVTIKYAKEQADVHEGKSAQEVTVNEVRSGGAQFVQSMPLVAGHIYVLSVWLKGKPGVQTSVALRQGPAPYETYGAKSVVLTGSWQQVIVQATVKEATDGYFMIYPPVGSSLLIDDASAIDVSGAVSSAPAKTGNLLPDGSFEAGLGGGWTARAGLGNAQESTKFEDEDPRPKIDTTTAADQNKSVKVLLPCAGCVWFSSPLVAYNYGRIHTASAWLKSDVQGATARIEIKGSPQVKDFRLTNAWQRFSFSTVVPFGDASRVMITEVLPGPGAAWIDGAELVEGSRPSDNFDKAVEITLSVNRPGGVFFDGESAVLGLSTANAPAGSNVRATCLDLYGQKTDLAPVAATALTLQIAPDAKHPRGVFKVTAQVYSKSGQPLGFPTQQVYARLPRPRDIAPEKSYFGVHIPLAPEYFQIARAVGARWTRIHDASWVTIWPVVEPKPGVFEFTDTGVDAARKAGMAILGMFDGGPLWATQKPNPMGGYFASYNKVDAPGAIDEWKVYIDRLVSHYKGKIDYWEVWNEPYGGGFTPGSTDIYGNLLKAQYPVAKKANPNSVIVGMDTYRSFDDFTDGAMKIAGGSSSYDEFSFHDYYGAAYGGPKSVAAQDAAYFDAFERKYGHVTPRWITESAPTDGVQSLYWPVGKEQDTRIQYTQAVRFDVTEIGAGVQHIFYYSLHGSPGFGETSLTGLEHDRTIRSITAARAVLASLIDGAKSLGRTEPLSGVDSYRFERADGSSVRVLWSYDGNDHVVSVRKGNRVLDAIGNPLPTAGSVSVGREPVYVLGTDKQAKK